MSENTGLEARHAAARALLDAGDPPSARAYADLVDAYVTAGRIHHGCAAAHEFNERAQDSEGLVAAAYRRAEQADRTEESPARPVPARA